MKENKEYDEIFENVSFVEMEFSKLIDYLTKYVEVAKVLVQ